ncbi:LacI family DNA-binding transcriptional regulator [Humibacter ginsengisoli]
MAQQPKPGRRPTLAVIAKAAGTSVPTVSKALRAGTDVAPETRERIVRVATTLGYWPTASSAKPRTSERRVIDLIVNNIEGTWVTAIIKGVSRAAERLDIDVAIRQPSTDRDWIGRLIAHRSYGVISASLALSRAERSRLASAGIPVVALDPNQRPDSDLASVGAMNWEGGRSAGEHLLGLGHHRFAVLDVDVSYLYSRARLDGFRSALSDAGIELTDDLIFHAGFDRAVARDHANGFLAARDRPTGVFACTEGLAFGVYDAAAAKGIRIPDELSVVGFDDLPDASTANPPMTTVRQPFTEIGGAAVRMLVRLKDRPDDETPVPREELATQLVVRRSTAPAPVDASTRGATKRRKPARTTVER